MHDVLGKVQVILPANCLLDVDALNSKLGRELQAIYGDDDASIRARHRLVSSSESRGDKGIPCVVDRMVGLMDEFYLDVGDGVNLVKISKNSLDAFLEYAREEDFAVPVEKISANSCNQESDFVQINQAIKKFTCLRIKQRLDDTLELPPLPATAKKIIHLRADPEAGVNELADVVETDPPLAAQVVSWASSSFYAAPGKIKSVRDAIIRVLGFDLVMNLSMGLALGKTLQDPKDGPRGLIDYWQQSVWVATACGALAGAIPREERPEVGLSYLSGLLHNFGYLILAHVFPPHFSLICRYIEANEHLDNAYIEHHLLGITREQLGSRLMHVWGVPDEVVVALRHQKTPAYRGIHSRLSGLIFIARNMLTERGIPLGAAHHIPDSLYQHLCLDPGRAAEVIDDLIGSKDEIMQMAGMMEGNR
ncbi:MAG: signal transduction protein [Proteobacteria bacterium]|nr:MAG: signal transduction protein [Pseudomonadota bacterium]